MSRIYRKNCDLCGKHYESSAKRFCSHKCSATYRHNTSEFGFKKGIATNRYLTSKKCKRCNKLFRPRTVKRKYCSKECYWIYRSNNIIGDKHPNWTGGSSMTVNGYRHTWASSKNRVLEHRHVMEQHLGRKLKRSEHVHHINHNKTDNRIENLRVLTHDEHNRLHANEQWSGGGSLRNK